LLISFLRRLITQTVFAKTITYGRKRTGFVEGKKPDFDVGLN